MREILFRGKRKLGNEWIEGSLHIEKFTDDEEYLCCEICQCDVYPETVGQYTGLTDKNGKKIFEGDIVKYKHITNFSENEELEEIGNENPERVTECNGVVKWLEKCGCFSPVPERYDCDDCWYSNGTYDFEVIGNIHDNPELLKGGVQG